MGSYPKTKQIKVFYKLSMFFRTFSPSSYTLLSSKTPNKLVNVLFASLLAAVIIILWSVSGRHLSVKFHGRQTVSEVYSRTEDSNPEKRFQNRRDRVRQVCDAEGIRGLDLGIDYYLLIIILL